jgi:phage terminase large subunit-like protein
MLIHCSMSSISSPQSALRLRAGTDANRDFLSPVFLDTIVGRYAGSRLGRQELLGEIIEERPDALVWAITALIMRERPLPPSLQAGRD